MLECGPRHAHILQSVHTYVEQLNRSQTNPLSTCLLEGPCGCGKTALAATVGIDSGFPFLKIVSAENMIGLSESTKCAVITEVFDDAYKSPLSIIILDDIERLVEYVPLGPCVSRSILGTILDLLQKIPPQGSKLLVIGTSSIILEHLESMKLLHAFDVHHNVPTLNPTDMKQVLEALDVFDPADVDNAVTALDEEISIKRLLMLIDMAAQGGGKGTHVHQKIELGYFFKCLQMINT
ncbi:unnamed protein product [Sphagnum troendelagicum]|uniref:Vesicle-fusing ATPase n=1 Tax=Sphagnum troendelagicum TaxID=128251 RepID=A0ABP0UMA6_9BRYO